MHLFTIKLLTAQSLQVGDQCDSTIPHPLAPPLKKVIKMPHRNTKHLCNALPTIKTMTHSMAIKLSYMLHEIKTPLDVFYFHQGDFVITGVCLSDC